MICFDAANWTACVLLRPDFGKYSEGSVWIPLADVERALGITILAMDAE